MRCSVSGGPSESEKASLSLRDHSLEVWISAHRSLHSVPLSLMSMISAAGMVDKVASGMT